MLKDLTIEKFLEELASEKPTPGGGSAAALVGAMAAALVSMVAQISGNKKTADRSERFRKVLLQLMDEDAESFDAVIKAYRLPKETGKEKRESEIEKALQRAAEIPLQTARYSYEVLKLVETLMGACKQDIVSDVGTAALFAEASITSALLNVKINLSVIEDEKFKEEINRGIQKIADYFARAEAIMKVVQGRIAN